MGIVIARPKSAMTALPVVSHHRSRMGNLGSSAYNNNGCGKDKGREGDHPRHTKIIQDRGLCCMLRQPDDNGSASMIVGPRPLLVYQLKDSPGYHETRKASHF